jgi:exopolysaccharide biosynthesis protein
LGRLDFLMIRIKLVVFVIAFLSMPALAAGPTGWKPVQAGVQYRLFKLKGPVLIHVVKVDRRRKNLAVRTLRSLKKRRPISLVTDAKRKGMKVVVAINGDFFSFTERYAIPWGMQVSQGRVIREPTNKSVFYLDRAGPHIERITFNGQVQAGGKTHRIHKINTPCKGNRLVLHNGMLGKKLRSKVLRSGLTIGNMNRTLRLNLGATGTVIGPATPEVASGTVVLSGCGTAARWLKATLKPGVKVKIDLKIPEAKGVISESIGGGPRVVRDGKISVEIKKEDFSRGMTFYLPFKHPRSAVGIGGDGRYLYLVHVEGRVRRSKGITLNGMAAFFKRLGCRDAMMFDGGGSANMVLQGKIYGPFGKRGVANVLTVIDKR